MAISARQIRSTMFRERFVRALNGNTGLREFMIDGASTIDELVGNIAGLPKPGDLYVAGMTSCVCLSVSIEPFTIGLAGETNGRFKATAEYGPPEFTVLNNEAAPTDPGQAWSEFGIETISQNVMYARGAISGAIIPDPIDNGRGVDVKVGVARLTVNKTYAKNVNPPLGDFLALMRPQSVNAAAFHSPPMWGHDGAYTWNAGELLYQGFEIQSQNGLKIVKHTLFGAEDWHERWTSEDDKGQPRLSYEGKIYPEADFSVLL